MDTHSERYRSGHNEAVLKTVCPKGRVGSNPTLSARHSCRRSLYRLLESTIWRSTQEAEGTPLERVQVVNSGARVQIPPSPFEMFKHFKKLKKLLTNNQHSGKISELLDKSDNEENQSTLTNKQ